MIMATWWKTNNVSWGRLHHKASAGIDNGWIYNTYISMSHLYLACSSSERCLPMMAKVWGRFCFTFSWTWEDERQRSFSLNTNRKNEIRKGIRTWALHLHAGDVNPLSDTELLPHQSEFGHAVQNHVVELEQGQKHCRWWTVPVITWTDTDTLQLSCLSLIKTLQPSHQVEVSVLCRSVFGWHLLMCPSLMSSLAGLTMSSSPPSRSCTSSSLFIFSWKHTGWCGTDTREWEDQTEPWATRQQMEAFYYQLRLQFTRGIIISFEIWYVWRITQKLLDVLKQHFGETFWCGSGSGANEGFLFTTFLKHWIFEIRHIKGTVIYECAQFVADRS